VRESSRANPITDRCIARIARRSARPAALCVCVVRGGGVGGGGIRGRRSRCRRRRPSSRRGLDRRAAGRARVRRSVSAVTPWRRVLAWPPDPAERTRRPATPDAAAAAASPTAGVKT